MKKETFLKELENLAALLGFAVRYEKGTFSGGDCRVHQDKILVINKFLPLEGRIATIIRVISSMDISTVKVPQKLKKELEAY